MMSEDSNDPRRDLRQTDEWFRDILVKLLGWGWAAITLVVGWTAAGDQGRFSLKECFCCRPTTPQCDAAVGLVLGYLLAFTGWAIAVKWAHARCPEHATIPSKRVINSYLCVMAGIYAMIFWLVLD